MPSLYLPQTWVDDDARYPLSAARFQNIENGIFDAQYAPSCRGMGTINMTISSATFTFLTLNENWDSDNLHDLVTNPGRITIKTPGIYLVYGQVQFNQSATGDRVVQVRMNGATTLAQGNNGIPDASQPWMATCETTAFLHGGDYLELGAYQSSGAVLGISPVNDFSSVLIAVLLCYYGGI
jgi:hypothetical protein